jgi:hypothetical protein
MLISIPKGLKIHLNSPFERTQFKIKNGFDLRLKMINLKI